MFDLSNLKKAVQKNCDLVDADHAQDYGLCIYLLRMREHYRWTRGFSLYEKLDNSETHNWILDTEEYWENIAGKPFSSIPVNGSLIDPFEAESINKDLTAEGIVYGGGLGYGLFPAFFLAELDQCEKKSGFKIYICGKEHAKGIFGTVAMFKGNTIYVRTEALRQLLWGRYEEWRTVKHNNRMEKAFSFYDFNQNAPTALDHITRIEIETLIQHEIGEGLLEKELGSAWSDMLSEFHRTKTEILLRATRDIIADCTTTLPFLVSEDRLASLHLFFANFSDMRGNLFPELKKAFYDATESGNYDEFQQIIETGRQFWLDISKKVVSLFQMKPKEPQTKIEALIENSKF